MNITKMHNYAEELEASRVGYDQYDRRSFNPARLAAYWEQVHEARKNATDTEMFQTTTAADRLAGPAQDARGCYAEGVQDHDSEAMMSLTKMNAYADLLNASNVGYEL